ncbi:MAG: FeoB-associated Cys-rich membrane protein [Gemmatimonadetes bacterium]|nr:FeoB-associated Cys-rich membrane protein [Gemmatimonadota bacterium]MYB62107.1 FeoB-associated Cys-rich membrane protein [Gemmatimonadota bacterium]
MDLQTLIVAIVVGVAAAFVLRTFTRQFTSRDRKGCGSCAHGGSLLTGQTRQSRQSSASRDDELIQVEPIQVEESIRE